MNKGSILIADDEEDILDFLSYALKKENYIVYTAQNGNEAIEKALKHKPDLIILDVMMPELNGYETLKKMRNMDAFKNTLIAFFTAKGDDLSEIEGFEMGADDYIHKPIRPKAFLARVNALLRRISITKVNDTLDFESIKILINERKIEVNNQIVKLPKMQFNILKLLAGSPNKYYTRAEIYNLVWGKGVFVGDRTLDVHIRKIREKIGDQKIQTSAGIGYAFIP